MSHNIAVQSTDAKAAINFYSKILGFSQTIVQNDFAEINANPLTLFVQHDEQVKGLVMELFVEDLEEAKAYLIAHGCKIIRWKGKGKDCYIEDPFGVRFNIWEEK